MRDEFERFGAEHFTLATQHCVAATSDQDLEVGCHTGDSQNSSTQLEMAQQLSMEKHTTAGESMASAAPPI